MNVKLYYILLAVIFISISICKLVQRWFKVKIPVKLFSVVFTCASAVFLSQKPLKDYIVYSTKVNPNFISYYIMIFLLMSGFYLNRRSFIGYVKISLLISFLPPICLFIHALLVTIYYSGNLKIEDAFKYVIVCASTNPFFIISLLGITQKFEMARILLRGEAVFTCWWGAIIYGMYKDFNIIFDINQDAGWTILQLLVLTALSVMTGMLCGKIISLLFLYISIDYYEIVMLLVGFMIIAHQICNQFTFNFNAITVLFWIMIFINNQHIFNDVPFLQNTIHVIFKIIDLGFYNYCIFVLVLDLNFSNSQNIYIPILSYIFTTILRMLSLWCVSPLLKCMNKSLTMKHIIILGWAPQVNTTSFVYLFSINYLGNKMHEHLGMYLLFASTFSLLINSLGFAVSLKCINLRSMSAEGINSIKMVLHNIYKRRNVDIIMLKFYWDMSLVDWAAVVKGTILQLPSPYPNDVRDIVDYDPKEKNRDKAHNHNCPNPLLKFPMKLTQVVNKKISYYYMDVKKSIIRQHDTGFSAKETYEFSLRILEKVEMKRGLISECITEELNIQKVFKVMRYHQKKCLLRLSGASKPSNRLGQISYDISQSISFKYIRCFTVAIVLVQLWLTINTVNNIASFVLLNIQIVLLLFVVLTQVFAYAKVSFIISFKYYIGVIWQAIEFYCLLHSFIDFFIYIPVLAEKVNYDYVGPLKTMWYISHLRYIYVISFLVEMYFLGLVREKESLIVFIYDVCISFLHSYQQIIMAIASSETCQDPLKVEGLFEEQIACRSILSYIQSEYPWVDVTTKTTVVLLSAKVTMLNALMKLKSAGFASYAEYEMLNNSIQATQSWMRNMTRFEHMRWQEYFHMLPWINNEAIGEFLYRRAVYHQFPKGTSIVLENETLDGIHVIYSGTVYVQYNPNRDVIARNENFGCVPVYDYVDMVNFSAFNDLSLSAGNVLGILAFLTNRRYDASEKARTDVQTLYISKNALNAAHGLVTDTPLLGLDACLWKYCLHDLAYCLLLSNPKYEKLNPIEINIKIHRSFVPSLSPGQKFQITEGMEDVLLMDGSIEDTVNKVVYLATRCLPKHITEVKLLSNELRPGLSIIPKLMIIPTDEYDRMELLDTVAENVYAKSKRTSRKKLISVAPSQTA